MRHFSSRDMGHKNLLVDSSLFTPFTTGSAFCPGETVR